MDVEMHGGGLGSPLRSAAPSLFAESPLRNFGAISSPIPLFQPSPQRSKRARLDPTAIDEPVAQLDGDEPGSRAGTTDRSDDLCIRQGSIGAARSDSCPASDAKPDPRVATVSALTVLSLPRLNASLRRCCWPAVLCRARAETTLSYDAGRMFGRRRCHAGHLRGASHLLGMPARGAAGAGSSRSTRTAVTAHRRKSHNTRSMPCSPPARALRRRSAAARTGRCATPPALRMATLLQPAMFSITRSRSRSLSRCPPPTASFRATLRGAARRQWRTRGRCARPAPAWRPTWR